MSQKLDFRLRQSFRVAQNQFLKHVRYTSEKLLPKIFNPHTFYCEKILNFKHPLKTKNQKQLIKINRAS